MKTNETNATISNCYEIYIAYKAVLLLSEKAENSFIKLAFSTTRAEQNILKGELYYLEFFFFFF